MHPCGGTVVRLVVNLLTNDLLRLIFPFLARAVMSRNVKREGLGFVRLVLTTRLVLMFDHALVRIVQHYVLLRVDAHIGISLVSSFLSGLVQLPVEFFSDGLTNSLVHHVRSRGHVRDFLARSILGVLFSALAMIVFNVILTVCD